MNFFITIILIICLQSVAIAQSPAQCDSLIRKGVVLLGEKKHNASLENLNKAFVMAKENRWHDQSFLALNNIGANYYALLNYGEALHYYLDAYQIAISNLDHEHEMIVLNNIAILYMSDKEYPKAAEYGERALSLATNTENIKRMGLYAVNLGLIYNKLGDFEKADHYFKMVDKLAIIDSNILFINEVGKTENAYLAGEYNRASELALLLLAEAEEKKQFDVVSHLYLLLSQVHFQQQQYTEALTFGRQSVVFSPDLESKIAAFNQLVTIHHANESYKNALSMKDSVVRYTDSLHHIKNGKYFESNKLSFEIKKYQQDAANSTFQLQQERKFHYSLLGALGAVFLAVGLGFRNSHLKNRQKKETAERERAQALLELKQKESERLLLEKQILEKAAQQQQERSNLKHEIEIKNRKLSSKALYVAERNHIIQNILHGISSETSSSSSPTVKKELKKLNNLIKSDESWEDFAHHFEAVNQGFLDQLKSKHPSLNSNDLRFISYLYMNLSQKEIATILNISPDACRKRKERIAKKIGLKEGTELHDYLYSI